MKINSTSRTVLWLVIVLPFHVAWAQPAIFTQLVLQATPTETLTVTPATTGVVKSVRFDVSVSGAPAALPTGSIIYMLKTTDLSIAATSIVSLSGGAAVWITTAPAGNYTISAAYSGDANYRQVSADASETGTPLPPDFDLALSELVLKQGQSWTGILQVIPINGFAQTVTFACDAPSALGCSLPTKTYSFAQPNAAGPSSGIPLTITSYGGQFTSASFLLLPFMFVSLRHRTLRRWTCMVVASLGLITIWGCGTNGQAGWKAITPKGTYNVTITGMSGGLRHAKQLTVIVE